VSYDWIDSEGGEALITGGSGNQVVLYRLESTPHSVDIATSNGSAVVIGLPRIARQLLDSTVEGVAFNGSRGADVYNFTFDSQPTNLRHIEIRAGEDDDALSIAGPFEVLDSRLQGESYGTNFYDGGGGFDTLSIAGLSSDFIVDSDGTDRDGQPRYVVRPRSGDDAHLVLYAVESIRFLDQTQALSGLVPQPVSPVVPAPIGPQGSITGSSQPQVPLASPGVTTSTATTTTVVYSPTVINNYNIDNSINNSNVNSNNVADSSTTNITTTNNSVAVSVSDVSGNVSIDLSSLIQGSTKGSDQVAGTLSSDVIGSGKGVDRLTGDAGSDQFVFNTRDKFGPKGADLITDFDPSENDQLILGAAALQGIREILFEAVASKKALKAAAEDKANLIYLQPTGQLFYDQNGSGRSFGKGGLFAILQNAPSLSPDNIALL